MTATRRRLAGLVAGGLVAAGLLLVAPPPAVTAPGAAPPVPDVRGRTWERPGPTGRVLVWRSPGRLPVTDARPEFRAGPRLLGYPRVSADGRRLSLPVEALGGVPPSRVQVWLGLRRLDSTSTVLPGRPSAAGAAETGSAPAADPGAAGPHAVRTFDYSAPDLPWRRFAEPMEVLGHAVVPVDAAAAPLVLFLHGRHIACYGPGDTGRWPCTGDSVPVPSYLGYDYLQRTLASQGFATVSISANAVNAQDGATLDGGARARAALVRHHLDLLAGWSADPANADWGGRLDLDRVVLVGHSRGGEGVDQAAIDAATDGASDGASDGSAGGPSYRLRGQVLLAPTDFGWQTAPYLPTEVLLGYCDGDVSDLQGQRYVDAAQTEAGDDRSLRSSVLLRGANHNFFNTEWTPRLSVAPSVDDWFDRTDPVCGARSPTRLTAAEQRRAARTFVAAGVHAFLGEDAGAARRWLDAGHPVAVPDAGPALAWTSAIGGRRDTRRLGDGATPIGAARPCLAGLPVGDDVIGRAVDGGATLCGDADVHRQPHWTPAAAEPASVHAAFAGAGLPEDLTLSWQDPGTAGGLALGRPLDLSGRRSRLDVRLVVRADSGPVGFRVVLGSAGTRWAGPTRTLAPFPGGPWVTPRWARTLRVRPAEYAEHVDLARVDSVELLPTSSGGQVWLLDVSRYHRGAGVASERALPAVRLGRVVHAEGDAATGGVAQLPFRVFGEVTEPARFGVAAGQQTSGWAAPTQLTTVTLQPGQRRGTVGIRYEADDLQDLGRQRQLVFAASIDGVVTSGFTGVEVVRDDDPAPTVTFTPARRTVSYGDPLVYRLRLSAPVDYYPANRIRAVRSDGLPSVRTSDVTRAWLRAQLGGVPDDVPLWRVWHDGFVDLSPGSTRARVEVPTVGRPPHAGPRALTLRLVARRLTAPLQATVRVRPVGSAVHDRGD